MQYGTGFALGAMTDVAMIRDFAQTLDGAGFDFVTASGHLLSAELGRFPNNPPATYVGPFHEPFVLFSYLAGITERLRFRTSISILPLFQTAVVAKQAAELSILSGERFELGVGISWSEPEYQALGQDIHTRGRRMEEQITLLRKFWTEPHVTFKGRWHEVDAVGLGGRLPKEPIPIWLGSGTGEKVLRRVAAIADGWIPGAGDVSEPIARLRGYVAEAGRDPATFPVSGRLVAGPEGASAWVAAAQAQQALGVSHLSITAGPDAQGPAALQRVLDAKQAIASELGA